MAAQKKEFFIDTNPALHALKDELGTSYREVARVLGVSHSHIWHALQGDRNPISVNLLVRYAQIAKEKAGVSMEFHITVDGKLRWKFHRV